MDTLLTEQPLRPGTTEEAGILRSSMAAAGLKSGPPGERKDDNRQPGQAEQLPPGVDAASPLATLLTMWQLGQPVAAQDAASALGIDASRLSELGLVRETGDGMVAPEVVVVRQDGIWLACDSSNIRPGLPLAENFVLPLSGSALAVAGCVPRQSFATVVDVGTGCGVLALLAARHAGWVVGTDINRRALAIARFNAWLNGIDNVELREGSLFEPVAGETFDLVVANPPFVISPETRLMYRDGQGGADEMSRDVVRGAAERLRPGGLGVFMVNWAVRDEEAVFDRPHAWMAGTPVDAVVIANTTDKGEVYAREWLGMNNDVVDPAEVDRWTAHYRKLNISAIATGMVALHRPAAVSRPPWFASYTAPMITSRTKADHLVQLIALQDFLHGGTVDETDPSALLSAIVRPANEHEVTKTAVWRDGGYHFTTARARIGRGFPFSGTLELGTADLLSRFDGHRTVGEVLSGLAAALDVESDEVFRKALPSVRKMLYLSLLLPAGVADVPPRDV